MSLRVDSDFVRVLPPAADELQFIDRTRILEAQKREAQYLDDEALICGVDVSGGGAAWNVMAFRRGTDARSIPRIRIPGEHTRDRSVLVGKLAELLKDQRPPRKVSAMFIDMAFGSPIYERLRALGFLALHRLHRAPQAVRQLVEGDIVLRAESMTAGVADEREVVAAGVAEVDFAAGVRAAGVLDGGRAVFVAVDVAEDRFAVVTGCGHARLLCLRSHS
jgi:hypothetical protein